ncbi:MAG: ABC transporter ATP-binding protein [Polyangiaceae bacterium]|jgi:ATP-binding cassette, subfamily B, bacterial
MSCAVTESGLERSSDARRGVAGQPVPDARGASPPDLPDTPFRFACRYVRFFRWWYLATFLLETGSAAVSISIPYALGGITRKVASGVGAPPGLPRIVGAFVALSVAEVVFSRVAGNCQFTVSPRLRQKVTNDLHAYLQHHAQSYFNDSFAGALAHRISETALGVTQSLWALLFDFWPIAITLTVAVTFVSRANGALAAFVGVWAVVFVSVSYVLAKSCQPYARRHAAARSVTSGKLVDSVANVSSVRLFARLLFERRYVDGYLESEVGAARVAHAHTERIRWFQHLSALTLKVGTLWFSLALWRRGRIDLGSFVMSTSMALLIITEARNLGRRFMEFFEYVGNIENGVRTIVRPHDLTERADATPLVVRRGEIRFAGVTFAYRSGSNVFDRLDLTIRPGERVGLVGYSGSGKSTLVNLILRLYDPQKGSISVDGVDIRAVSLSSLHEQIGLIPQEPTLFHRTLRENIAYGRPGAGVQDVETAARRAHAHDFIAALGDGYDSLVGERGVKLSGGQRQRIAIARVILKNAPILILDEATSSLDSVTEKRLQSSLEDLMAKKTVIVVAHRLSTIAHLDRILVFDAGRIVEDGTHADLRSRGGTYAHLWSRQVDGFLPGARPEAASA